MNLNSGFQDVVQSLAAVFEGATPALWLAKLVGAVAGSLISIAYVLPRGRREACLRFAVGLVIGLVFGGPAGIKLADFLGLLEKLSAIEIALMGASLASLCAWWGLGILQRMAERWKGGKSLSRIGIFKEEDKAN